MRDRAPLVARSRGVRSAADGDGASAQQPPDGGDVHGLPRMRGAHHGDLVVGKIRLVHREERDRALHRLLAGAAEQHPLGVAGERAEPSLGVADRHVAGVHGLDETVANHMDELGGAVIGAEA